MAKTKKQQPIIEEENKYPIADYELALSLFRTPALTDMQQWQVLDLHRKYINPVQPMPQAACGGCSSSFVNGVYIPLRDWMSKNNQLFK